MKLAETKIKNAKAGLKPRRLADGRGLYLLITPVGGKFWRAKYRYRGKEKTITFGQYPDISVKAARERHADALKLMAEGKDPMAERKAQKAVLRIATETTFQKIAEEWHKHWSAGKSERHAEYVMRRLKADAFPAIGSAPIASIEAPALVRLVKGIQERGVNDIAKRVLETLGQIFRYAVAHDYCKRNPAADIKPADVLKSTPKTNYARIDAKELPGLLRAIEVYQGTPATRLAIKLIAHTFVRTGELIGARWEEFDFEAKRWNIPAERMKMRTPHIVPLSQQALETLELLRPLTGEKELLFPGERDHKKPMSNNTILKALERMGYKGRMTAHGFRGIASTILHEQGFDHQHIELQLAHAPRNAVSAAYNHALYLDQRTKMMQWWSDYLETQQRGKVLPMKGTAA
ncbi:tyrosine-type recombinase/integrase [Edaphobacter sp.]|uniref:tyrosine-type recombinase/integrase n=1 Tax=Edaphobacter sp. TaxID=1934404 RepID=UPI002DBFE0CA|nr:tyrosine-type recombinase/integrase [Edaphobacter sp.]HEU5340160.1 tyrosine-type recombinase/integrase [Edaphobacter sp.]